MSGAITSRRKDNVWTTDNILQNDIDKDTWLVYGPDYATEATSKMSAYIHVSVEVDPLMAVYPLFVKAFNRDRFLKDMSDPQVPCCGLETTYNEGKL